MPSTFICSCMHLSTVLRMSLLYLTISLLIFAQDAADVADVAAFVVIPKLLDDLVVDDVFFFFLVFFLVFSGLSVKDDDVGSDEGIPVPPMLPTSPPLPNIPPMGLLLSFISFISIISFISFISCPSCSIATLPVPYWRVLGTGLALLSSVPAAACPLPRALLFRTRTLISHSASLLPFSSNSHLPA